MTRTFLGAALVLCVSSVAHAQRSYFEFTVPADAVITVNGQSTQLFGQETRGFQTAPLEKNRWYCYDVVVTVSRNSREFRQKERFIFQAGENIRRSYLSLLNDAEGIAYPRAHHILGEVRQFDQRKVREIRAIAAREKSNNALADAPPRTAAFFEDLETLLSASENGGLTDVETAAISDVTYERLPGGKMRAILEVRRSSKVYRIATGHTHVRDTVRYYCTYSRFNGDWMLENYWSTGGDSVGDFMMRWEGNLRRMSEGAVLERVARRQTNLFDFD